MQSTSSINLAVYNRYAARVKGYGLKTVSGFINPKLFGAMRNPLFDGRTIVLDDGSLSVAGEKFVFADKSGALEPGTEVCFYPGDRGFCCALTADIEEYIAKVRAAELEEKERERIRMNAYRDESIIFNSSLQIPVKWVPGVKDVLSGLSANSWGDGRSRATVEHVFLLEDLHVGRLKRSEHDFLCGNSNARWGAGWREPIEEFQDGDGNLYQPKVTCKTCLAIAERLGKAAAKGK
jgi:hypothetical protein